MMAGMMESALQRLISDLTRPLAHVVHIGAGTGADLAVYQEAGAKAVTLIEADAETADQLEGLTAAHKGATVIAAVVSGDTRKRPFRVMNFPELSSLRVPTGLKELFPGLRILSKDLVSPVNPARLITPLELSDTGANLLVIEAPGEALGILRALEPDNLLQRFDAIHLQEARVPLYDKAPAADDIRAYLVSAGFVAKFEISPEDPERPHLSAHLDRAALQHKRAYDALGKTLEQAQKRNAELTGQLEAVQQAAHEQADQQHAELEAVQQATLEKADQQHAELEAVHKTTGAEITALRAGLAEAEQQALEHTSQADGLRQDLASAREQAAQEMTALQSELTGAQQESAERAQQIDGLRAAREEMGQEMAALQGELAKAREQVQQQAQQQAGQLDAQIEDHTRARAALVQEMEALRAELTGVQAGLASTQQESAERAQQVNGLRAAREEVVVEMDALRAELKEAHKSGAQNKEARAGAEHRLMQAREEMLKAEGQINLIRDLLLQGSGL